MSKSSREQMVLDEKKVLSELVKHSNKNIETIAKQCNFSRQKVWRIVKNLEEKHIIWGYTAVFDEKKIDLLHYMLMVKRSTKKLEEKTIDIILSRVIEDIVAGLGITIESSSYTHGDYDWVITFTAQDIKQAKKFSNSLISLHPGVIEKITIIQTLMFIKKQNILNPEKLKLREFL
ncbi:MAG TPA: Lrp/AsnC family transcriptional regulator [Candidatus Thermoplasmatota archaeon]|nr:Lrp/AsnC family transcriptional regulator [Candidatus Thermoplasmatota archaeon]